MTFPPLRASPSYPQAVDGLSLRSHILCLAVRAAALARLDRSSRVLRPIWMLPVWSSHRLSNDGASPPSGRGATQREPRRMPTTEARASTASDQTSMLYFSRVRSGDKDAGSSLSCMRAGSFCRRELRARPWTMQRSRAIVTRATTVDFSQRQHPGFGESRGTVHALDHRHCQVAVASELCGELARFCCPTPQSKVAVSSK